MFDCFPVEITVSTVGLTRLTEFVYLFNESGALIEEKEKRERERERERESSWRRETSLIEK